VVLRRGGRPRTADLAVLSVAKPLVFALVCDVVGPDEIRDKVGVNATGLPFNSVEAIDLHRDGRTNSMVNAGAIATTSLVPGTTAAARWHAIVDGVSRFAGRTLQLDAEIYASASATSHRNRDIVVALERHRRIVGDPVEALDLYTRQSSPRVTARDLAVMGATLADGGVNPLTGNIVKGQLAARGLSRRLGLDLFRSAPDSCHCSERGLR
jgi:glutaminase